MTMSSAQAKTSAKDENGGAKRGSDNGNNPDETFLLDPPSPNVDVHALFGIPRTKRASERSGEHDQLSDSDTDDQIDSDDEEFEEFQEGEYLLLEDNEEFKEMQTKLLSEQADLHRTILLPVFTACTVAYDKWVEENKNSLPETEMGERRKQLLLYRKVLDLYGSDADWQNRSQEQKITTDAQVLETSHLAKDMGPPPDEVTEASVIAGKTAAQGTLSLDNMDKMLETKMQNVGL